MVKSSGKIMALLTASSFILTGCSILLERDYSHITPHNPAPTTEGDPSTLRADSYQELVNALIYFIATGTEKGTIRLYMDSDQIEADLEAACLEVVQEDPLGAYAVEYIKYGLTSVVSYSEAAIHLTYRRTKSQINSIIQATGVTAIRNELSTSMASFQPECVLRISYFDEDESLIHQLAQQAYHNAPDSALGMPEVQVTIYPSSPSGGKQRIVEILLTYPLDPGELEHQKADLDRWLDALSTQFMLSSSGPLLDAAHALSTSGSYDPEGGSTAYSLMTEGRANSEGFALAMAALGQRFGLGCQVVSGTRDGQPHFWNVVQTTTGRQHLDLTAPAGDDFHLYTDQELSQLGYQWDAETLLQYVAVEKQP